MLRFILLWPKLALLLFALLFFSITLFADSASRELLKVINYYYGRSTAIVPVDFSTADALFRGKPIKSFREFENFAHYYLDLVPLEGRDFLFEALSSTVFAIDIQPLVSISTVDVFSRINSPLSYFSYLQKLGFKIRNAALRESIRDPGQLKSEVFSRVEKLTLFDDFEGYIPLPMGAVPYSHGTTERIFSESVWQLTFQKAGFERPVVFSGFVSPKVAEHVLNDALFLDDTVFGLSWGHGKFPHLIQLGMLLESGVVDKDWIVSMARNDEWRHILDRVMSGWSGVYVASASRSEMRNVKTIPGLSSPTWLQESLVRHFFSDLISLAANDRSRSCEYLALFFNEQGKVLESCQHRLERYSKNIKALENWVIFDFLDDISIMKEQAQVSVPFRNVLRDLISVVHEKNAPSYGIRSVDDVLNCSGSNDCDIQFLQLVGQLACMATFHNSIVEPFVRLREQYYLGRSYQLRNKGQGYRVYLLPEQEVCGHCIAP